MLAHHEHGFQFDGGLHVVALLEAASCFHDAASRIGEVVLVFGRGALLRRLRFFASGFASGGRFFGAATGKLGFIGCLLFFQALFGAFFDDSLGLFEFGNAVFTTLDFIRDTQAVLQGRAVGVLGFSQQRGDLFLRQEDMLLGVSVAHCAMFAGVGEEFTAIHRDGDITDFYDIGMGGQFEDLMKARAQQVFVLAPEFADGVVIGMGIAAEITHRHILVG